MKSIFVGFLTAALALAHDRASGADTFVRTNLVGEQKLDFAIHWPPEDPALSLRKDMRPLLRGKLKVRTNKSPDNGWELHLLVTLNRSPAEADREFWNSRLAFPDYDWMRYVRFWDADEHWLWPNLPYLLRMHGTERIHRYGGVDPGKGADNDFAAVLIRKYEAGGEVESSSTKRRPLVSAEWWPVGVTNAGLHTIVHSALSDEFRLQLSQGGELQQGQACVWLVFADFLGAKPPSNWPKTPEFAGGILAFFEVKWESVAGSGCNVTLGQTAPKQSTGFDWKRWTARTRAVPDPKSTARLSD